MSHLICFLLQQIEQRTLLAEQKKNKQEDKNEPKPKYTHRKKNTPRHTNLDNNQFANGWNEDGRNRYRTLMESINETRAYYNESFDKRMKAFATKMKLQAQQKKRREETRPINPLPTDMELPDVETIRREKPNAEALTLNAELLEFDDTIPNITGNTVAI